jgi:hypothetical protein
MRSLCTHRGTPSVDTSRPGRQPQPARASAQLTPPDVQALPYAPTGRTRAFAPLGDTTAPAAVASGRGGPHHGSRHHRDRCRAGEVANHNGVPAPTGCPRPAGRSRPADPGPHLNRSRSAPGRGTNRRTRNPAQSGHFRPAVPQARASIERVAAGAEAAPATAGPVAGPRDPTWPADQPAGPSAPRPPPRGPTDPPPSWSPGTTMTRIRKSVAFECIARWTSAFGRDGGTRMYLPGEIGCARRPCTMAEGAGTRYLERRRCESAWTRFNQVLRQRSSRPPRPSAHGCTSPSIAAAPTDRR